jgi:hypothetical protein
MTEKNHRLLALAGAGNKKRRLSSRNKILIFI